MQFLLRRLYHFPQCKINNVNAQKPLLPFILWRNIAFCSYVHYYDVAYLLFLKLKKIIHEN